jgi:imidazolonepropionase-like amidohydrolase
MPARLFVNASIFDGTGADCRPGEVLVEGNRISAVAHDGEHIDVHRAEVVLDAGGATLMPGLVEPHAHLTFPSAVDRRVEQFFPPVEEHVFYTAHNAKTLLDYGFTAALSGSALRPPIEVKLRDEIAAGFLPGPRLKAASGERAPDGARIEHGNDDAGEAVRTFCTEMIALGVDSLKFILSGAGSVLPDNFDTLVYSDAELAIASELARAANVNLLGHAYNSESIRLAIRHGFNALYHCNFADEATLDLMAEHKAEYMVVPAVGIIVAGLTRQHEFSANALERSPEAQRGLKMIHEAQLELLPKLRSRGIRVLPGGDYGFAHNPHGRNAWEFELFVDLFGFRPNEVLAAATRDGAALFGHADDLGLVKAGYLADLLLVDGNPLEDIRLLQDRDRILMVMKDGAIHRRADHLTERPALATA